MSSMRGSMNEVDGFRVVLISTYAPEFHLRSVIGGSIGHWLWNLNKSRVRSKGSDFYALKHQSWISNGIGWSLNMDDFCLLIVAPLVGSSYWKKVTIQLSRSHALVEVLLHHHSLRSATSNLPPFGSSASGAVRLFESNNLLRAASDRSGKVVQWPWRTIRHARLVHLMRDHVILPLAIA